MRKALTTLILFTSLLFADTSYYLQEENSTYEALSALFDQGRVTKSIRTLKSYGFEILDKRHGGIVIATHPDIEGYLLKLIVDSKMDSYSRELKKHRGQDEKKEFEGRCRRRALIQNYLDQHDLSRFILPEKWLFNIPDKESLPRGGAYLKKHTLLVAEKMAIPSESENRKLWMEAMTEEILDELFILIKELNLNDIGPHNLYFLDADHLTLVDTKEWTTKTNCLLSLPRNLNKNKAAYWRSKLKSLRNINIQTVQ